MFGHDLQAALLGPAHQAKANDLVAEALGDGIEQLDQITVFLRLAAHGSLNSQGRPASPPIGQTKSGSLSAAARKRHLALTDDVERFIGELIRAVDPESEISDSSLPHRSNYRL